MSPNPGQTSAGQPTYAAADRDAAEAVLGAVMLSEDALDAVTRILTPQMFDNPAHELIYDAVLATAAKGVRPDPITVADTLRETRELDRAGGAPRLHEISTATPAAASAEFYAQIVRQDYQRRSALIALSQASHSLSEPGSDVENVLGSVQSVLDGLTSHMSQQGQHRLGEGLEQATARLESGTHGHTTGLRDWDEATGGLAPGQLVIIGARPAMGKTVVGLEIARANAKAGHPVLFFTFEMSSDEMICRVLSAECAIPSDRMSLVRPRLTEQDWAKIAETAPTLDEWPFILDSGSEATVESVLATVRSYHRKHPDLIVVIDYLQLMTTAARYNSRQEQVAAMTRQVKLAALSLNIPIVALSQLNRASESRADKRPGLADLRESGAAEQDADQVVLLHREDVYDPESPRAGEMDLIIAKNRSGATKTISAAAQLHYMRVKDMARGMGQEHNGGGF